MLFRELLSKTVHAAVERLKPARRGEFAVALVCIYKTPGGKLRMNYHAQKSVGETYECMRRMYNFLEAGRAEFKEEQQK